MHSVQRPTHQGYKYHVLSKDYVPVMIHERAQVELHKRTT